MTVPPSIGVIFCNGSGGNDNVGTTFLYSRFVFFGKFVWRLRLELKNSGKDTNSKAIICNYYG